MGNKTEIDREGDGATPSHKTSHGGRLTTWPPKPNLEGWFCRETQREGRRGLTKLQGMKEEGSGYRAKGELW